MEGKETLASFFFEKLGDALKEHRVETAAETEHYLVRLLADYATHPLDDEPLAIKLLSASDAPPVERRQKLKEVGDTSLFVSGFWSESFARRVVDVDYYIGIGGNAYGQLARVGDGWSRDPFNDVFEELSAKFKRLVTVLSTLSQRIAPPTSPQDLVRLYDKYRNTGSTWARARLAAMGVFVPGSAEGGTGGKIQ
jgi:hypothetical protein